jgi:hypothetical protein
MNAQEAKQLAFQSVEEQIKTVNELIYSQSKQGMLSCTTPYMLPATRVFFEEKGYLIDQQTFESYTIFKISWH